MDNDKRDIFGRQTDAPFMTCPRCSAEALDDSVDCPSCGIIFAKWRAPRPGTARPTPRPPEFLGVTHAGWKATGIGLVLVGVLTFFPFISYILHPITTLVHEIGHTAMFWLFGYTAIPAFDFGEGGGVTMSDYDRAGVIVAAWVFGLLILAWWKRDKPMILAGLGAAALAYFLAYGGKGEDLAICLGGHGGEIVFGCLFLYRALTGWGCKIEVERPLYAFLAFKILFRTIDLGLSIQGNTPERFMYLDGKRGIDNDLVTGAQLLGWSLDGMARVCVAAAAAAIPLAFWAASIRKTIGAVSEAEETV